MDALVEKLEMLPLFGDSQTRHVVQALFSIARNDFTSGCMNPVVTAENGQTEHCTCDNQYSDGHTHIQSCYPYSLAFHFRQGNLTGILPDATSRSVRFFEHPTGPGNGHEFRAFLRQLSPAIPNVILYLSAGLWMDLNEEVFEVAYQPYLDIVRNEFPSFFPKLIVIVSNPPPSGKNKPVEFLDKQNNQILAAFADQMRAFQTRLKEQGIRSYFFNKFQLAFNSESIDGTHYQSKVNTVMAQLLLHALADITGNGKFCRTMFLEHLNHA